MPTTGIINSNLMRIRIGTTNVTCAVDANLSLTNATRDTTCKDSGQFKEGKYAMSEWSISGSALASFDGTMSVAEIMALALAQTTSTVTLGTGVTGDDKWSGSVLWTNVEVSSPGTNENVTVSFTAMGTGTLTAGTES